MLPGATFLMSADGWGALATVILAASAVTAGLWALYAHHKAKRLEAARWTQTLLHDLYQERFHRVKCALQYEYDKRLGPLLEDCNSADAASRLKDLGDLEGIELLEQLDMFLNYFEYTLYLEQEGHFEGRKGHAVFDYWFAFMADERLAELRTYIVKGRFKRLARELDGERKKGRGEGGRALLQPSGVR